jgi:hypothetical protein
MKRLQLLGAVAVCLVTASAAYGVLPRSVTVTGKVRVVSTASINVAGTSCVLAPTHPRMMMPTIIRELEAGDRAQMTCVRNANGQLALTKLFEKPSGVVIVVGTVSAKTATSVTVRNVSCLIPPNRKPVLGVPTIIREVEVGGQVVIACSPNAAGRLTMTAVSSQS